MRNGEREHGLFSFNELITTDLDGARDFYGGLLGWSFTETKTIYGNRYLLALKEGTVACGMMLRDGNMGDDVSPCWDPYVTVDDVDGSAARVEELGGRLILPPTEIPGVGRFCVARDPQGISLNLITYFQDSED